MSIKYVYVYVSSPRINQGYHKNEYKYSWERDASYTHPKDYQGYHKNEYKYQGYKGYQGY